MKKLLTISVASVMLVCSSLAAFAAKAVKEIDIRSNKSEAGNYYVVFCAHGPSVASASLAGHTFVAWAEEEPDAVSCKNKAYGMYTHDKKSIKLLWDVLHGPVVGNLVEESFASRSSATHFLIVRVTKAQYDKTESVRDKQWKGLLDREYELLVSDCVSFSSHIAKILGLTVPERDKNMTPSAFTEELMELNN